MKRFSKVLLFIFCICLMISLTACGNKTALTASEFKTKMENKNFIVGDATYQMSQYDYIEKVYLAKNEDLTYQIEFYQISDVDNAYSFYIYNKKIFEESKQSNSKETTLNIGNRSKYTVETAGKYKVVSRIDNTVIYINVDEQYKSEVKTILDELGY